MDKSFAETSKCYVNVTDHYQGFYSRKPFECTLKTFFFKSYFPGSSPCIFSRMGGDQGCPLENILRSDCLEVCTPGCPGVNPSRKRSLIGSPARRSSPVAGLTPGGSIQRRGAWGPGASCLRMSCLRVEYHRAKKGR